MRRLVAILALLMSIPAMAQMGGFVGTSINSQGKGVRSTILVTNHNLVSAPKLYKNPEGTIEWPTNPFQSDFRGFYEFFLPDGLYDVCVTPVMEVAYCFTVSISTPSNLSNIQVEWESVLNKPVTFTPSTHNHLRNQITDLSSMRLSWNQLDNIPITFPPSSHTHTTDQISGLTSLHLGWANIDNKPTTFTPSSHTHPMAQISDLSGLRINWTQIDNVPPANAFDPTAPGPIGGTTPAPITGTTVTANTSVTAPKHCFTASMCIYYGTGSPESVLIADVGSLYQRTDGGVGTTLYYKGSGTSNTGWQSLGATPSITYPYDLSVDFEYTPQANDYIRVVLRRNTTCTSVKGNAATAATTLTTFSIQKNGVSIGSCSFGPGTTTCSTSISQLFVDGDVYKVQALQTDATINHITLTAKCSTDGN